VRHAQQTVQPDRAYNALRVNGALASEDAPVPSSVIVAGCSLAVVVVTFAAGYLFPGYFGGGSHGPYDSTIMLLVTGLVATVTCTVTAGLSLVVLARNPALRTTCNVLVSGLAITYCAIIVTYFIVRRLT
jgi:hypothetical protein